MTAAERDAVQAIFAVFANCERLDDSGEPNTLSLREVQTLGTAGLNLIDPIGEGDDRLAR